MFVLVHLVEDPALGAVWVGGIGELVEIAALRVPGSCAAVVVALHHDVVGCVAGPDACVALFCKASLSQFLHLMPYTSFILTGSHLTIFFWK